MKTAKTYAMCLQNYTDRQRKWNRRFPIIVGVLSFVGSMTFTVSKYGPLIASLAVFVFSILKIVLPIFGQPEEELNQLDQLYSYFGQKTQDLESLWNYYGSGAEVRGLTPRRPTKYLHHAVHDFLN